MVFPLKTTSCLWRLSAISSFIGSMSIIHICRQIEDRGDGDTINYACIIYLYGEQNFDKDRVGVVAGATAVSEETSSDNVLSPEGSISTAGPEAEEAATTSVATRHQPTSRRATYNQTVPRSAAGGAACEMRRTPSSQNKGK
jgi:hypothetical protein